MLLEQMSDEDLIFLMKSESKVAERAFYRRYSDYSLHLAKNYYVHFKGSGISVDELYAVAFSQVHEALKKADNITTAFYVYWKSVVKNAVYDYVKENSYEEGGRQFAGASLDDTLYPDNEVLMLSDVTGVEERNNSLEGALDKYIHGDKELLTDDEKLIADLFFIQECSRKEICEITNLGKNRVNYLIRTSKQKIQQLLKENYL